MKAANSLYLATAMSLFALAHPALARDTPYHLPVDAVINSTGAVGKLDGAVKFLFAGQPVPPDARHIGEVEVARKTDSFARSDEAGCQNAMLDALVEMQEQAMRQGANAVVNIVSNYHNVVYSSPNQYECHAGRIVGGVSLKGEMVKLVP